MESRKTHDVVMEFAKSLPENTKLSVIHTAWKVKNEFNEKWNSDYYTQDKDWDWIDDEVFNSWYRTLSHVLDPIVSWFKWVPSVWRINALSNKKKFIPSCSKSMTLTNKIIDLKLMELEKYKEINYHKVWVSTVWTANELEHRKFSNDKQYWLRPDFVADSLTSALDTWTKEVEIFIPHPLYKEKFQGETNLEMSSRFWSEITWKSY